MNHLWLTRSVYVESNPLAFEQAAEWAAAQLREMMPENSAPERAGLYLATTDAGAAASIIFWGHALQEGAGFANPHDFPWTLASSPAGYIALQLQLRGPNYTLVGAGSASQGALQHALDDLTAGRVESALLVRFDFMERPKLAAAWLTGEAQSQRGLALDGEMYLVPAGDDVIASLCKTFEHRRNAALVAG
jgi:3-oxoacyl-(acyl-carrier-protein) synthase